MIGGVTDERSDSSYRGSRCLCGCVEKWIMMICGGVDDDNDKSWCCGHCWHCINFPLNQNHPSQGETSNNRKPNQWLDFMIYPAICGWMGSNSISTILFIHLRAFIPDFATVNISTVQKPPRRRNINGTSIGMSLEQDQVAQARTRQNIFIQSVLPSQST